MTADPTDKMAYSFAGGGHLPEVRQLPAGIQETTEFQNLCPVSAACLVKRLGVD
jgi:hypothetical protein